MAQVCRPPADTLVQCVAGSMICCGSFWLRMVPMPSSPLRLYPQHHRVPPMRMPQVWYPFAAMRLHRDAPPAAPAGPDPVDAVPADAVPAAVIRAVASALATES